MNLYNKLFSSILLSSVWEQSHETVRVWITLIALTDTDGCVPATPSAIAHQARVTSQQGDAALNYFMSPDADSRCQDHDGRRLEKVDGGYQLLGFARHRNTKTTKQLLDASRQARKRAKDRGKSESRVMSREQNVTVTHHISKSNLEKGGVGEKGSAPDFDLVWRQYPKRSGGDSKTDARKQFERRVAEGESPESILAGTVRYAAYCEATGKIGTEFVKQGATFFGKGRHWEGDFAPPATNGNGKSLHGAPMPRMFADLGQGEEATEPSPEWVAWRKQNPEWTP